MDYLVFEGFLDMGTLVVRKFLLTRQYVHDKSEKSWYKQSKKKINKALNLPGQA